MGSKTNYVVKTKTWLIKALIIVEYTSFMSVACYYDPETPWWLIPVLWIIAGYLIAIWIRREGF
ncbi:MAG: hypothetical protein HXS48_18090 [Theionarchaea archaeon]|nr:hypothetical protein [Theionarchaea archaeon]